VGHRKIFEQTFVAGKKSSFLKREHDTSYIRSPYPQKGGKGGDECTRIVKENWWLLKKLT
jgi:hypothetical protein